MRAAIDAVDRGAANDRDRSIDGGVGVAVEPPPGSIGAGVGVDAPRAGPGSGSGGSRIGGARRRKPNAVAADDRSIAPVNAARDAAVRARRARMVAATRAAALERERPREGTRVRTPPSSAAGPRGDAPSARRRGAGRRRRPGGSESAIGEAAIVATSEDASRRFTSRRFTSRRFASGLASMTVRVIVPRRGVVGLARGGGSGGSREAPAPATAPGGSSRNAATTFLIPRALRRASGTSGLGTDSDGVGARVADGSFDVVGASADAATDAASSTADRSASDGGRRARGRAGEATVEGWTTTEGGSGGGAHVRRCVGQSARWHAREQYLVALPADARKGRDGEDASDGRGMGSGGRAGRARGRERDAHLEHRNTDGEPHAPHAAPPALILALGRTRTSRRGGSIREWAHRRRRVARRDYARGKPQDGHETATRVRAASWATRAREIQRTARCARRGARGAL